MFGQHLGHGYEKLSMAIKLTKTYHEIGELSKKIEGVKGREIQVKS